MMAKIWVDDVRPAPGGYTWMTSVIGAICEIQRCEENKEPIEVIDLDHDAGDNASWGGGDFINVLNWCEETGRNYPIHIHSMNPVGAQNMRAIIRHNNWIEV